MRVGSIPDQAPSAYRTPLPSGEPLAATDGFRNDINATLAGMAGFSDPNASGIINPVTLDPAGPFAPVGCWVSPDITTLTGSELGNGWMGSTSVLCPQIAPRAAGILKAVAISLSADVGAAGVSVTATVFVNGVASALTVTLAGGAGTETVAVASVDVPVSASDKVTVYASKTGGVAAGVKMGVTVYGLL